MSSLIFSYDPLKHPDVYHPIDHPDSKSDMFLLKNSEFSFITHDSALKLNDIRTVSVNRILYQQSGRISPSSDTYKQIEKLVLQKYFPSFYHDFEQNIQTITSLNEQLKETVENKNVLEIENEQLKAELKALKNPLSGSTCSTFLASFDKIPKSYGYLKNSCLFDIVFV